ncbi:EAL domain-containing protein [Gemmatimonas sp.]|uniref:putative bifunctional diguanylate cyclase/phosphodiesterase n=1 Tax=Gemmatimonas sp. TaxID=1962908 RepID=UPI00333F81D6
MTDREPHGTPRVGVLRVLLVDNDRKAATRSEAGLRARLGEQLALSQVPSLALAIRSLMEERFDAVVLELDVADASGIATLAGIRGAAPAVPVIVYTRVLDDTLAIRALRAGAHECLDKRETRPEGLARMLNFALERQRRISLLEAARVEAAHRATHDPLTGLANRELFLDQLDRALAFGARYSRKTGLLFVDLDGFKSINDTRGHALGDTLLKAVSARLLESVRRSDAVARLGGDEFVVLLPDVTSRRDVAFVKETILSSLRAPIETATGDALSIEASIGSAMSPLDGATAQELLDAADADMYREKYQRRRDRALTLLLESPGLAPEIEPPNVGESMSHRREARLRAAAARGEFEVFYQPVLDVVADRIIGAEALLRWRDPDRGLLSPSGFLSLAEDTGLIVPIGEQVLRDACEALVRWRASGVDSALRVAVNLSAVQLREHGFERRVAQILAETGCPPEALTLELTENSTVVDGEMAMETLRALKGLGVRLVVDDFGVGHASLTFLREAPVDGIKIDRRFVSQLLVDQRDQAIVASMVRLARGLGLDVVAEGVENGEQSQRLARLQCFAQQGRHFSDAVPYAAMTALLAERNRLPLRADPGWGPRRVEAKGA